MLRALTIVLLAVGIAFVGWSLLVMTGARDQLVATMTADEPASTAPPEAAKPAGEAGGDKVAAEDSKPAGGAGGGAETKPGAGGGGGGAAKPEAGGGGAAADMKGKPTDIVKGAAKGSLKSPYAKDYKSVAEEGHKIFMAAGCNGCHGGTGGGGMGPPLTNQVWVYGKDDDTLFRLVTLGSDALKKEGYNRKGSENVVGPMPPMGGIVKSGDDLWKLIAWIRSINPSSAEGGPAPTN